MKEIRRLASAGGLPQGEVSTVGRVMAIRRHGKTSFFDVHDEDARLQCQIRWDVVGPEGYDFFARFVERGDFLGASGGLFYTKMGELTLQVEGYTILAKALYDMPRERFGLRDVETRYRQRYLDLLLNPGARELFVARSRIVSEMRRFLAGRGFLEVETPIIQECYGGAAARPFTVHVNDLGETRYLQISPELYLKRLMVGGFNRVFTICKNFRNEEIDATHNPEFTMMEAYEAYADYNDIMGLAQDLITTLALEARGSLRWEHDGVDMDLTPPWRRLTMYEALEEYAGLNVDEMNDDEIREALWENDLVNCGRLLARGGYNRGLFVAQLFDHFCKDRLIQPTFVTDHPRETVPLCKIHRDDPDLIERFELFISGMEMANAYTELNDPILQERLFSEEMGAKRGDEDAHPFDTDYVEALRYGMPPAGGLGVGVDRLVMLLTGQTSIKEVILFPMMRRVDHG